MGIERRYLLKVLGLGTAPRIFTFCLTLVSFPLMVKALGAGRYGIFVYLSSVMAVLESFADFGVSSAAGKAIAETRSQRPEHIRVEFSHWVRAQSAVAVAGFIPLAMIGHLIISATGAFTVPFAVFFVVTVSVWLAIGNSFIRSCLTSLLSFKQLAFLDVAGSLLRSAGWLFVAFVMPTILALSAAGLIMVIFTLILGTFFIRRSLRQYASGPLEKYPDLYKVPWYRRRVLVLDSMRFFGLRLATRCFNSFPILIIGRMQGPELVGIIGAFLKIADVISFPIMTIGNGLKVRAFEIKNHGIDAAGRFFDLAFRLTIISLIFACGIFILAGPVAAYFAGNNALGPALISIMAILIFARAAAELFAPAIDYVGALGLRVLFLLFCTVLQVPLIWAGARYFAQLGAVTMLVLVYCGMVIGYIFIAKRTFLGRTVYRIPRDVYIAAAAIVGTMIAADLCPGVSGKAVLILGTYGISLALLFWSVPVLRNNYLTLRILET